MNREIKFKAFVRGYMADVVSIDFVNKYITWDDNQYDRCDPPNKCFEMESFEDIKLLEYIGLKDYNKKDLYEGYMVKIGQLKGFYIVVWDNDFACFRLKDENSESGYCFNSISHKIKIIGNIYQNPELLESVQK